MNNPYSPPSATTGHGASALSRVGKVSLAILSALIGQFCASVFLACFLVQQTVAECIAETARYVALDVEFYGSTALISLLLGLVLQRSPWWLVVIAGFLCGLLCTLLSINVLGMSWISGL